MLVVFAQVRDANLWFQQGEQKVSAARFLRGAFLAQVFKGTELSAVTVGNELDHHAQQDFERKHKP